MTCPYDGVLSTTEKNKPLIHAVACANLKIGMPNERTQEKKSVYCIIPHIQHSRKLKLMYSQKVEKWLLGDEKRWKGKIAEVHKKLFGSMDTFIILIELMVSQDLI